MRWNFKEIYLLSRLHPCNRKEANFIPSTDVNVSAFCLDLFELSSFFAVRASSSLLKYQ